MRMTTTQRYWLLPAMLGASLLLGACSDDDDDSNPAPTPTPSSVAFDSLLLDIVDPAQPTSAPVTVTGQSFTFPQDTSAFAALFPQTQ